MDGNALRSFLDTIQEATDKFMGNGGTKDMWSKYLQVCSSWGSVDTIVLF